MRFNIEGRGKHHSRFINRREPALAPPFLSHKPTEGGNWQPHSYKIVQDEAKRDSYLQIY